MRFHITEPNLVTLGPMMSPTDYRLSPWVAWEQAMLYKQYDAMTAGKWEPTARQFYTGNTALARKHLLNIGGFDERFRRAEDIELAYRLYNHDLRFVFNPQAVGYHYAQRSFRAWLETPYAYGRNDIVFTREQHPWILQNLREEFTTRNLLTRMLVQGCLDRSTITKMALFILKRLADTSFALHVNHISIAGYSAIFNLRYYQGAADELGGRAGFLNKLSS
jgi:GT2 family glycosyltransferase